MAAPNSVIRARGLTKVYRMGEVEVHALRGVDIDLCSSGELVVLLGASGSGKSTLLNILGGLDTPTAGSVRVPRPRPQRRRRGRADRVPPPPRRLRLPVLQPDPEPDRARERRAGHRHRRRPDGSRARRSRWSGSASASITSRRSSPAASSSASRSRARSPSARTCCCATSRPARSTPTPAGSCCRCSTQVNRELGTTTAIITHNAPIAAMADRVITLADGPIKSIARQRAAARAPRSCAGESASTASCCATSRACAAR